MSHADSALEAPRGLDALVHLAGRLGVWNLGRALLGRFGFLLQSVLVSLIVVTPLLILIGWQFRALGEQALQERRETTQHLVDVVRGVVAAAHAQEVAGKLGREQAQRLALDTIKLLRYAGDEYFWVNDMQLRMLMHPMKPELNGTDLSGIRDPDGVPIFVRMVDVIKAHGSGYVEYQWPHPSSVEAAAKVSYVEQFEPWGRVIGTGVFVDQLQAAF